MSTVAILGLMIAGCSDQENPSAPKQSSRENSVKPSVAAKRSEAETDLLKQAKESLSKGDLQKAVTALKAAIYVDPKNAEAHLLLARTMMHFKSYEQAIGHFNAVLAQEPNNGEAYFLLSSCYELSGDKDKALKSLAKSITIFKQNKDQENLKRALLSLQSLTKGKVSPEDISSISK